MKLNRASLIYADEPIEDCLTRVHPLESIGEPLQPVGDRRVALVTRAGDERHGAMVDRLVETWRLTRVARNTMRITGRMRTENAIANILGMTRSTSVPWVRRTSMAIVCGGSSSLMDDIEHIRRLQAQGAIIVATTRAVVALARVGLVADLAVCSESRPSEGLVVRSVPTLFDITANPGTVTQVDTHYFVSPLDPAYDELARDYLGQICYPVGPSVTTLAISFLRAHGLRDIVLSGCPACDTVGSGEDYVAAANGYSAHPQYTEPVSCYDGETRMTSIQMLDEIRWFEARGVQVCISGAKSAVRSTCSLADLASVSVPAGGQVVLDLPKTQPIDKIRKYIDYQRNAMIALIGSNASPTAHESGHDSREFFDRLPLAQAYASADLLDLCEVETVTEFHAKLDAIIDFTARAMLDLWQK